VQDSLLEHAETTHKNKFLARFNLTTRHVWLLVSTTTRLVDSGMTERWTGR